MKPTRSSLILGAGPDAIRRQFSDHPGARLYTFREEPYQTSDLAILYEQWAREDSVSENDGWLEIVRGIWLRVKGAGQVAQWFTGTNTRTVELRIEPNHAQRVVRVWRATYGPGAQWRRPTSLELVYTFGFEGALRFQAGECARPPLTCTPA